jgi:molybdopterin converting factor subunit 1
LRVRVLYFATLRDRVGARDEIILLPDSADVTRLKSELVTQHPELEAALGSVLVAINKDFASDDDTLSEGDEVAFFPPVSGGQDEGPPSYFLVTEDELDFNALLDKLVLPTSGAACVFTGMVRGRTERGTSHETDVLEYEAYVPMAEAKMRQVAEEIRSHWPSIEGIGIVQRIGRLMPGTPTVLIACTAAHRDTGVFEAARYGIDRLKEIVPIWKKEIGPDGESWVEGSYVPTDRDKDG